MDHQSDVSDESTKDGEDSPSRLVSEPGPSMRRFLNHGPSNQPTLFTSPQFLETLQHAIEDLDARLSSGSDAHAACIGVFGPWGSGKTSITHYILDGVREPALRVYFVPSHLSARPEDIQPLLAAHVLRALVEFGQSESAIEALENTFERYGVASPSLPADAASTDLHFASRTSELLAHLKERPGLTEVVLERLLRGQPTVIAVDDLDRCSPQIIAQILRVSVYWAERTNTSFIFAADETHMRRAAQLNAEEIGGELYTGQALEKYIHRALYVPVGWTAEHGWTIASQLFEGLGFMDSSPLGSYLERSYTDDDVFHLLGRADCVTHDGSVKATPRTFKRRLDRFLNIYYSLLTTSPESSVAVAAIAAYYEPWEERILRLVEGENLEDIRPLVELVQSGPVRSFTGESPFGSEVLDRAFEHLYALNYPGRDPIPFEVVRAVISVWYSHESTSPNRPAVAETQFDDAPSEPRHHRPPNSRQQFLESPSGERPASAAGPSFDRDVVEQLRERQRRVSHDREFSAAIESLREQSASVERSGDLDACKQLVELMVNLCAEHFRRYGALPKGTATRVGNQALLAERLVMLQEAFQLHQFARDADPNHANISQNWVEFVLENELDIENESLAVQAISTSLRLREIAASHKPHRTVWHLLVLSTRHPDLRAPAIGFVGKLPDRQQGRAVALAVINRPRDFVDGELREIVDEALLEITDAGSLGDFLRVLAGASEQLEVDRLETLDLYLCVLNNQMYRSDDDQVALQNNLAIYLSESSVEDLNNVAFYLWKSAYRLQPTDDKIRRAFADFLEEQANSHELAAAVRSGDPLPEDHPLFPPFTSLPLKISQRDHWWEHHVERVR